MVSGFFREHTGWVCDQWVYGWERCYRRSAAVRTRTAARLNDVILNRVVAGGGEMSGRVLGGVPSVGGVAAGYNLLWME